MSVINILNAVALYVELSIIVVSVNQLFFYKINMFRAMKTHHCMIECKI